MQYLVFDIESSGLSPREDSLHGVGVRWPDGSREYFKWGEEPFKFYQMMADANVAKVGHNVRFDLKWMLSHGVKVNGPLYCTKLMQWCLDENRGEKGYGLKALAAEYLGAQNLDAKNELDEAVEGIGGEHVGDLVYADLVLSDSNISSLIARYCLEDVSNTAKLFDRLMEDVLRRTATQKSLGFGRGLIHYINDVMMPRERVLAEMELAGVCVDMDLLQVLSNEAAFEVEAKRSALLQKHAETIKLIEDEANEAAFQAKRKKAKNPDRIKRPKREPFNLNSGKQVQRLIYEKNGVFASAIPKTEKGQPATSANAVKELLESLPQDSLSRPLLQDYLDYSESMNELARYQGRNGDKGVIAQVEVESDQSLGRIFGDYNSMIATHRLSSRGFNLQNLPRTSALKSIFRPDPGDTCFVHADYSQIELRLAAHESQDEEMVNAFLLDQDLHIKTASNIFKIREAEVTKEQRQIGKTINFLKIFDGSPWRMQQALKASGAGHFEIEVCEEFDKSFWQQYRGYRKYLDKQLELGQRRGFVIARSGAVRRLPDLKIGQYLNHRNKEFTGPKQLRQQITNGLLMSDAQLYWDAKKRFNHAKNQLFNFPIQHMGAVITALGMKALQDLGYKLRNQVHDSVTISGPTPGPRELGEIQAALEGAYALSVPLKVDIKILRSFDEADLHEPTSQKILP